MDQQGVEHFRWSLRWIRAVAVVLGAKFGHGNSGGAGRFLRRDRRHLELEKAWVQMGHARPRGRFRETRWLLNREDTTKETVK